MTEWETDSGVLDRAWIASLQRMVDARRRVLELRGLDATFAQVDYWRQAQRTLAIAVANILSKDELFPEREP
jgi:uncharacterized ferritin-like protein (DUF455 family)